MSSFKSLMRHLKANKHHPQLGGLDSDSMTRLRSRLQDAIGEPEVTPSVSVMYWEFIKSNTFQYLSKPVIAGAFSFVVIASGWLTTVRASDSLPGETLYSVKMISERAQLRLASLDRKAVLHTEFAGRRLQEAGELRDDQDSSNDNLVHDAMEAYKQEVASAADNLRQLKDEGDESTLATATSVQQNLQAIDTTIDQVAADSATAEASQEAFAAKEATKAVSDIATNVVVEVHEEQQTDLSEDELKNLFKDRLGQIAARQRFDLERIKVIRTALSDKTIVYVEGTVPKIAELNTFEYLIVSFDEDLNVIMNNFAAGGYRSAFASLQEIDRALLETESELARIEITIMDAKLRTTTETTKTPVDLETNSTSEPATQSKP